VGAMPNFRWRDALVELAFLVSAFVAGYFAGRAWGPWGGFLGVLGPALAAYFVRRSRGRSREARRIRTLVESARRARGVAS